MCLAVVPVRHHGVRHLPLLGRRMVHPATVMDARAPGHAALAGRAPDDDVRSLQPRQVRLHGRPRRLQPARPDGPPTPRTALGGLVRQRRRTERRRRPHASPCSRHVRGVRQRVPDEPPRVRQVHEGQGRRRARARGQGPQPVRSGDHRELQGLLDRRPGTGRRIRAAVRRAPRGLLGGEA
ncbi:hypothetical protein L226DRAFT_364118 [Lentinus tigrinus ALCF2SS1-7]|uniref:uncharacterized protein n=1 Tax=Lentinus tigrinus ALCF2SS1-7 TaxID=1328758 RepID=UPI0011662153|nr:hypothetical protein L226DRAFT_364118 [Lentinus tigrinus ALCF2SS1-7]